MHSQLITERELTSTKQMLALFLFFISFFFFTVFIRQFNLDGLINQ